MLKLLELLIQVTNVSENSEKFLLILFLALLFRWSDLYEERNMIQFSIPQAADSMWLLGIKFFKNF